MHEQSPILQAAQRRKVGSRYATRERGAGLLPAVVYGHGREPVPVTVNAKDTVGHIKKGEKVFRLSIEGEGAEQVVLLKDVQFDYLGTNIVHADFARVDLNERVRTRVHVVLIGEAIGLKAAGNLLMHPMSEIEIECRVADLPETVEVDITELDVGHAIHAGEVKLPKADMKLITDPKTLVAQILIAQTITTAEETVVGAGEAAQPEVITAKKPAEGEAAAADKGADKGAAKKK